MDGQFELVPEDPDAISPLVPAAGTPAALVSHLEAELDRMIRQGIIVNRRGARTLRDRLEKAGSAYRLLYAQLAGLLDMPKWREIALNGPSLQNVMRYGFAVGKIS